MSNNSVAPVYKCKQCNLELVVYGDLDHHIKSCSHTSHLCQLLCSSAPNSIAPPSVDFCSDNRDDDRLIGVLIIYTFLMHFSSYFFSSFNVGNHYSLSVWESGVTARQSPLWKNLECRIPNYSASSSLFFPASRTGATTTTRTCTGLQQKQYPFASLMRKYLPTLPPLKWWFVNITD